MKSSIKVFCSLFILIVFSSCNNSPQVSKNNSLFQTSTINALLAGYYEGSVTFATLKQKGDLGIGTFNNLDGEMIALDGVYYQIKSDGKVYPVNDEMETPFSTVTNFSSDIALTLSDSIHFSELKLYLDSKLPTLNIFYAFKIEGEFLSVKTRSVPQQSKPYIPLVQVVATQPVFEFKNVSGTLVGFRVPDYMSGINVPGYHFHFISKNLANGGHLLDCTLKTVAVQVDSIHSIELALPNDGQFYKMPLTVTNNNELEKVEK